MHLISENFLFFAVGFALVFYFLGWRTQKVVLLAGSYAFCGIPSPLFPGILLGSTIANYVVSYFMERHPKYSRRSLAIGIIFNVMMLGAFKYLNFFSSSVSDAANLFGLRYSPFLVDIVIPLGLSFYTFQAISYLVDIHRGRISRPEFLDFAIFMAFWPKFIAGPIIRAGWLLPQLRSRRIFRWPNLFLGLEMMAYGLFLKVVLSDSLIPHIAKVFETPAAFDGSASLLAAFFFTFQIYGDFAGYSLLVIGMARILGYSVRQNFRRPNFATSFSDFWKRWHISLSTWLDDYIFRGLIPKRKLDANSEWRDVRSLFSDILGVQDVAHDATFSSLAGDSLMYVQVALALEGFLGTLPNGWEAMTANQLDGLRVQPVPATL